MDTAEKSPDTQITSISLDEFFQLVHQVLIVVSATDEDFVLRIKKLQEKSKAKKYFSLLSQKKVSH